jgi:hypothetical protein
MARKIDHNKHLAKHLKKVEEHSKLAQKHMEMANGGEVSEKPKKTRKKKA